MPPEKFGNQKKYLRLAFEPVSIRHSLLLKTFVVIASMALGSAVVAMLLTALAHRAVFAPLIPPDQFEAVEQLILLSLFVVGVAAVGVSGAVAWLFSRHLIQPISQLVAAMRRVFEADLTAKVLINRHDEFGTLGDFFNSMVDRLREIQKRSQAISALKSQFVSVAAHQLRTPLTGLKWSLQWLKDKKGGPLTSEQQKAVDQQFQAVNEMIRLVNELLDAAMAEEGKFGYNLQQVSVETLVEEVLGGFAQSVEARGVKLNIKTEIRPGLAVVGDPVRLKLALANLVDNAIRYTQPGGSVTITLTQQADWLTVQVADTGIGIPMAEQDRLFSKFFRATNAQRLHPDGSGLGLFIVSNVITGHGGKISVASKEGAGTTFTLTLPLRRELVPKETLEEGVAAI